MQWRIPGLLHECGRIAKYFHSQMNKRQGRSREEVGTVKQECNKSVKCPINLGGEKEIDYFHCIWPLWADCDCCHTAGLDADLNKEHQNGTCSMIRPCSGRFAPLWQVSKIQREWGVFLNDRMCCYSSSNWPFAPTPPPSSIHPPLSPLCLLPFSLPSCRSGYATGWWISGSPAVWLQDRGGHF